MVQFVTGCLNTGTHNVTSDKVLCLNKFLMKTTSQNVMSCVLSHLFNIKY